VADARRLTAVDTAPDTVEGCKQKVVSFPLVASLYHVFASRNGSTSSLTKENNSFSPAGRTNPAQPVRSGSVRSGEEFAVDDVFSNIYN
jgi:hypothetical protein